MVAQRDSGWMHWLLYTQTPNLTGAVPVTFPFRGEEVGLGDTNVLPGTFYFFIFYNSMQRITEKTDSLSLSLLPNLSVSHQDRLKLL